MKSDDIKMPAWNDDKSNRILHPEDYDPDTGKELIKPLVIYFSASERRELARMVKESKSIAKEQGMVKYKCFGI